MSNQLDVIGRAVRMTVGQTPGIPAKVDTGADLSSIWATNIHETDGHLSFVLFDAHSPYYTGEVITVSKGNYHQTRIANSFGHRETRYVVSLKVMVNDRRITASFSLANRALKTYPILIGRRLLNKKFLVDVSLDKEALHAVERRKLRELRLALRSSKT